ncbi:ABC transporter permease [Actinoplanes sp. NBRC 101535]|uniref:ABC transporter permease n=1 Tax=Actinoplanes sp. NBRC 101535 TaxID=3032196 RepID=UPI0024A4A137|nr:hypothetical protein Acsp01_53270 [Actinoplanes sp. NBRC 101535]
MAVSVLPFVRLKLRITRNGLRGRPARIAMFVVGAVFAGLFAVGGYLIFALPGLLEHSRSAGILLPLGGALLVLAWTFMPLLFFGVDSALDPAQFALLPVPRRTLLAGLSVAALIGLPALATLVATGGMVHTAARLGGPVAAVAALLGIVSGLLLCVALSRSVTSAFATALRSRRSRDTATILLAVVAAALGPAQLLLLGLLDRADWDTVTMIAQVVGWTPLGAPWSVGVDAASGRLWAVPLKLLIVLAVAGVLVWWWSRTIEQAMLGASTAGGRRATTAPDTRRPVERLLLRGLPRNRFGALTSREARYWWRETRRRATLVTLGVVGVFLPLSSAFGGAPEGAGGLAVVVGAIAPLGLANQFGYEGSAYATNMATGVPGRLEVYSRAAAHALFTVPILLLVALVTEVSAGKPEVVAAQFGTLLATYGVGLALVLPISVWAAYPQPDTSGPFALSSGGGAAKALPSLGAMLGASIATVPLLIAGFLLGPAWLWVGLPLGLAYGAGAFWLGAILAGRMIDRRMPELLAAVSA